MNPVSESVPGYPEIHRQDFGVLECPGGGCYGHEEGEECVEYCIPFYTEPCYVTLFRVGDFEAWSQSPTAFGLAARIAQDAVLLELVKERADLMRASG